MIQKKSATGWIELSHSATSQTGDPARIDIESLTAPVRAKSVANVKWESGTLIAPSGGVSILASEAFRDDLRLSVSDEFKALLDQDLADAKPDQWWWG